MTNLVTNFKTIEMELYKKLLDAKKKIGSISKDSKNPFFKSKYFDINQLLEHVEPILSELGLLLIQPIEDGKVVTIVVDIDTQDQIRSEMELPNIQDPQKIGSAISYYRRYTLTSLLSIQAEDDDGNNAAKPPKKEVVKQPITDDIIKKAVKKKATIETLKKHYIIDEIQEELITKMLNNVKDPKK